MHQWAAASAAVLGEQAVSRLVRVTGAPASTVPTGSHTDLLLDRMARQQCRDARKAALLIYF